MKQKCLTMVKVMTALVLAVLMMVGSVSNVVGAIVEPSNLSVDDSAPSAAEAQVGEAIQSAAKAGLGYAADASFADGVNGFKDYENDIIRGMKDDLVGTGANADLASVSGEGGDGIWGFWYGTSDGDGMSTYTSLTSEGNNVYSVTLDLNSSQNYYFSLVCGYTEHYGWNYQWGSQPTTTNTTGLTLNWGSQNKNNNTVFRAQIWTGNSARKLKLSINSSTKALTVSNAEDRYTVTGSNATLFTNTWDPSDNTNKMSTSDSGATYVWTKSNVALTAGNFEFKICKNNTYAYPANNYVQNVSAAGNYNVTITLTTSNGSVSCSLDRVYDVTISAGTGGSVSPNGLQTGVSSTNGISVTATPSAGYSFSSWTKTNVTTTTDNATTTVKPTDSNDTHSLVANFTKNNYTVSYSAASNGTFTVKNGDTNVASGTGVPFNTNLTVTCTPSKGYQVGTVTYTDASGTKVNAASSGGGVYTFAVPARDTTVAVTFTAKSYTISGSSTTGGSMKVTQTNSSSAGNQTNWSIGATRYLRATPSDGYDFQKFVVTYATGATEEITMNNTDISSKLTANKITDGDEGTITVVAYFTKKPTYKVTVRSNSLAYGSATANLSEAYEGQEVTITATENTGDFSTWTVVSGGATLTAATDTTTTFDMPAADVTIRADFDAHSAAASKYYYNNYDSTTGAVTYGLQMTEGKVNGQTYNYYQVTGRTEVNQTFTVSVGNLNYNQNVYMGMQIPNDAGNEWAWDKGNTNEQFVRFMASDGKEIADYKKLSYSNTLDRNDLNRTGFEYKIPNGARWAQVKCGNKNNYTVHIDLSTANNGGNNVFNVTSQGSPNWNVSGWYHDFGSGTHITGDVYEYIGQADKYVGEYGTVGFNSINDFQILVDGDKEDGHVVCYPNQDMREYGDYYILVLEPNTTYTLNGVTRETGNHIEVIWQKSLPSAIVDDTPTVDIYAKNGTLRDSTFNRFTNLADTDFDDTYFEYTETLDSGVYTYHSIDEYNDSGLHTPITYNNEVSGYNSNYALMSNVPVGAKIKIKTTLSNNAADAGSFTDKDGVAQKFRDTHYMKAYSFNGATYQVNEWNNTGVYEEIWTVRDVNTKKTVDGDTENLTKDGKTIEVTPIYYMKNNSNCKTFYIDGYDGTVQGQWGNMLSVYPYYEGKSNAANAFGGYPGQPMLFWGGKYQMEIPLTVDGTSTGASVKGLTLHNAYWDLLHRSLDLKCNAKNHAQTYDYDDFYKLYKEKNPDTIIFDFKYQNTKDNLDQGYGYTNYTFGGTSMLASASDIYTPELVTDYFGRQVDVFGTLIAQDKLSDYITSGTQDSELLLVSTGYKDTYVGEYATIWAVYAPASGAKNGETEGQFIGYISSSMLYLNSIDRVSQYTDGTNTAAGRMSWGDSENKGFVYTYNYLKEHYKGVPALISYERELWNDSKDKAYRSDGKWYYSNKNDQITANILVQYCDTAANVVTKEDKALNDAVWTTDTFATSGDDYKGLGGEYNVGPHSNCSAYFTNTTPYLKGKTDSGKQFADSTKKFTFEAVASGSYLFVNWVRYSNGRYYEVSESELAESPMSSNDTYIARFVKSSNGTLKISHVVEQNGTYTGTGTPSVTVTVSNASDVQQFTQTNTDGTPIDITNFMKTKYSGYKINISLSTAPDEDCVLHDITNGSGIAKYNPGELASNAATVAEFTVEDALEGANSVTNLRYVSHLTTTTYTYNYNIRYTYTSRFWGEQYYDVKGSLSSSNPEDMALIEGKKGTAKLTTDFIIDKTPYEKNFRQMINWNYTYDTVGDAAAMTNVVTGNSGTTYTIAATVDSSNVINDKVKAEILLPYPHNAKSSDYSAKTVVAHHSVNDDSTTYDEYIFDESQEAVSIEAQAYKLFTTDGSVPDNMTNPDDTRPMNIPHLERAAEYVWKNPDARYVDEASTRYFTGFNFTLDGITYYCDLDPDKPEPDETHVILTADNTATWDGETYTYAVEATVDGKREVYTFMNYITDGVFNGGYNRYYINHQLDGFYMYDESGKVTGEKKYFTRWDIFSSDGTYLASSYNRYFNYSGYQNYLVKAIYDSDTPGSAVESPVSSIPTIVYLGDTRNQWTEGGQGSAGSTYSNASSGGDKLIHDFAISYDYYPEEIRTVTDKNIKIGMLIEQIGALEEDGAGNRIIDTSYYADKYKGTFDANAIKGYFEGTVTAADLKTTLSARNLVNSKIASTDGSWGKKFTDKTGDIGNNHSGLQPIDNMNRLQWAYTFTNTKTGGTIGANNNANFVYRASAYIIVDGTATVSSSPVYFTLYDSAHR